MNPPTPAPQPAPTPDPNPGGLTPNIVNNIPVKAPQAVSEASFNDEAELDKLMQDVGKQLKKEDKKPPKKGFLGFGHKKPEAEPRLAQPPSLVRSQPMPAPSSQPKPSPQPAAQAPLPPTAANKAKPVKSSSAPVFVIVLAIVVTGTLIAAAVYAYKK
ncbi:MAG: hypothetical protein ACREGG_01795 [Candidatus Saccharimonadales bacterium]